MVSASKAAREAKRAAAGKDKKTAASKVSSKAASKNASKASSVNGDDDAGLALDRNEEVENLTSQTDKLGISDRVTTGVLASLEASRDVKITSASLVFHGRVLFNDTTIEINYGRRYGLLGENGCGKSTLLKAIDRREFPFPEHIDIYLLDKGAPPTELGALEWVVREAQNEMDRLEKLAEKILEEDGPESQQLEEIYEVCQTDSSRTMTLLTRTRNKRRWTPQPSRSALVSFSPVSASTRRPSTRRQRTCPVAGECVLPLPRLFSSSPLFFCSMTRLPIWTWRPVCGWKNT